MFVVVIRDELKGEQIAVHRQKNLATLLRKVAREHAGAKTAKWWTKATDAFLKQHYNAGMSAAQIAAELAATRRRKITKNMVISRANRLGLAKRAATAVGRGAERHEQPPL